MVGILIVVGWDLVTESCSLTPGALGSNLCSQLSISSLSVTVEAPQEEEPSLCVILPEFFWPPGYSPETTQVYKCLAPSRTLCEAVRPTFLPLPPHPQDRASGLASGLCTRNLLLLIPLRVEHSAALSSWNLAEPEALWKAGLWALLVGWIPAAALLRSAW